VADRRNRPWDVRRSHRDIDGEGEDKEGVVIETTVNRELAMMAGFLFAVTLFFGALAWIALNYIESDVDRFSRWASGLESL
jgi:hypothetical protein